VAKTDAPKETSREPEKKPKKSGASGKGGKGKLGRDRAGKDKTNKDKASKDKASGKTSGKTSGKRGATRAAAEMPSTLVRSVEKAQETWQQTHDSAVRTYGEGERAHRTAFASLKHSFEKVGDHWEPKAAKGPSDAHAASGGAAARRGGDTAGGVDANASKAHLLDVAKRLGITGRTAMRKPDLVAAIDKANRRETAKSRQRDPS